MQRLILSRSFLLWLTGFLAAVISVLTLSQPGIAGSFKGADKAFHTIAFACLVLPTAIGRPRSLRWLIPAALLFGGAIELVQPLVGRGREVLDFLADIFGLGIGVTIGLTIRRCFRLEAGQTETV